MIYCKGIEKDIFFKKCPFKKNCKRFTDVKYSSDFFVEIPYNDEYKYCKQFVFNNKKEK